MSSFADEDVPFSKERKQFSNNNENNNNKYRLSINIDSEILPQLDLIFQNNRSSKDGELEFNEVKFKIDFKKFIEDRRNYPDQLIQLWNYYSNTNNHGKHTDATLKLCRIIQSCHKYEEFNAAGSKLIRTSLLIPSNIKVFYRGLSSMKPPTTNPILRLLNAIISFNKGEFVDEFVQLFNLDFSAMSKLFSPTKLEISADTRLTKRSIRYNAMTFILSLIEYSSSMTRKDILVVDNSNRRKILNNLFKYSAKFDPLEVIHRMLDVFQKCVLEDPFFTPNKLKSLKLRIFNQWNLVSLLQLYYISDNHISLNFDRFLREFFLGERSNVLYIDSKPWLENPAFDANFSKDNNRGINIGSKKFYINNQFAYHVLIEMKPWDNKQQLLFVLDLLKRVPELIPIYTSFLSSINGNFDPKLTFYWIGQALLLHKIISLPLPDSLCNIESEFCPNNSLIIDTFLPNCLNSTSLTKCLKSSNLLIVHLTLQILCSIFEKFERITRLYEQNEWNQDLLKLSSNFESSIPEVSILLSIFTDLMKIEKDNKLLVLYLIKVLNYYVSNISGIYIPQNGFSILNNYFSKLISSENEMKGIDLLLLDSFFRLQELTTSESGDESHFMVSMKWYSSSKDNNSLFCNLLKLNCFIGSADSLDSKVISLLNNLLDQSLIYHNYKDLSNNILIHQNIILCSTLKLVSKLVNQKSIFKIIWNLLDQTISRSVTPYKYIDLSNEKYEKISPFFIILFEQFMFVPKHDTKNYQITLLWLSLFAKYAVIIGEPKTGIISLFKKYVFVETNIEPILGFIETDSSFKTAFDNLINNQFNSIVSLKNCSKILNHELSFFENIFYREIDQFEKIEEVIVTDFDLVGCLNCIIQLIDTSKWHSVKKLMNKVDNYLTFADAESSFGILKKFLFKNTDVASDKVILHFGALIRSQYDMSSSVEFQKLLKTFSLFVYAELVNCLECGIDLKERQDIQENIWALDNYSVIVLLRLYPTNLKLTSLLLYHVVSTNLDIETSSIFNLMKLLVNHDSPEKDYADVASMVVKLLESQNISSTYIPEIYTLLSNNSNGLKSLFFTVLLKTNSVFAAYALRTSIINMDLSNEVLCSVEEEVLLSLKDELHTEFIKSLSLKAAELVNSLSENKVSPQDYNNFLKCINYCFEYFQDNEKELLASFFIIEKSDYDIFTASMLEFILNIDDFSKFDTYLNKCFLFLNKKFAETSDFTLSLRKFVNVLGDKLLKIKDNKKKSFLNFVSKNLISTQFEIIMKSKYWLENLSILEYLVNLVDSISKNKLDKILDFSRFLQIFLSNEKNPIYKTNNEKVKYLATILVYKMFNFNVTKNATFSIREEILLCYNGSISATDLLLFDILNKIEEKLTNSWLNDYDISWEFSDITSNTHKKNNDVDDYDAILDNPKLIEKEKASNSLTITLTSKHLSNSIKNFCNMNIDIMELYCQCEKDLWSFYEVMDVKKNGSELVYDSRFIPLLIINIDDLMISQKNIDDASGKALITQAISFDLRRLVDSGLLEYLIVCLSSSDENLSNIVQTILYNICITASDENAAYPEKELIKILLQKILTTYTMTNEHAEVKCLYKPQDISPLIYHFIAKFVPIISNPNNYLYERAYKYLLGMPGLSRSDLPLFKQLTSATVEASTYYKDTIWLLTTLIDSINTDKDIFFLNKRNILDWVFSLKNCPYFNYRIKKLIYLLLNKIQDIDNGCYTLVTNFGMIAALEIEKDKLSTEDNTEFNQYNSKKTIAKSQELVDLKEIETKIVMITDEHKRLREWINDDSSRIIKKICQ